MYIFDGYAFAQDREPEIAAQVTELAQQGKHLTIAALLFVEDQGSVLYTRLKQEAAQRVGISYQVYSFHMTDPIEQITAQLAELNADPSITGIIIQKPWRQTWETVTGRVGGFKAWWSELVSQLTIEKDVDGLQPLTLDAIKAGIWRESGFVLPATCQAVWDILNHAQTLFADSSDQIPSPNHRSVAIIGKSDLLGTPLYYQLLNSGFKVNLFGTKELNQHIENKKGLHGYQVIVSATGRNKLITGDMVDVGVIAVDVGEPKPDLDFDSLSQKAAFITPVPGGVGPVTVSCLLQNCVKLGQR